MESTTTVIMKICYCVIGRSISHRQKLINVEGGYLDFSHLTELKDIYITEIYMKRHCKSSRIKNHKITKNSLKSLRSLLSNF